MLTKGAIGNLINRYRAVLTKCTLINTFGSLAVASMLVLGGAGMAVAADYDLQAGTKKENLDLAGNDDNLIGGWLLNKTNSEYTKQSGFDTKITDKSVSEIIGGSYVKGSGFTGTDAVTHGGIGLTIDGSSATAEFVVGGSKIANNKQANLATGDIALTITKGTFGKAFATGDDEYELVTGGNYIKTNSAANNTATAGTIRVTINGGTFNTSVVGGSTAHDYSASASTNKISVSDAATIVVINGGDFKPSKGKTRTDNGQINLEANVIGGGLAYAETGVKEEGGAVSTVGSTTVTINGGTFEKIGNVGGKIVAGGYAKNGGAAKVTNDTSLSMTGGTVKGDLIGGGLVDGKSGSSTYYTKANVGGSTNVTVSGGTLVDAEIIGGGYVRNGKGEAKVARDTNVTVEKYSETLDKQNWVQYVIGGGKAMTQYAGDTADATVGGTANVTIGLPDEDKIQYGAVIGGGLARAQGKGGNATAGVKNTNVTVNGGTLSGVTGGGVAEALGSGPATASVTESTLTINGGTINGVKYKGDEDDGSEAAVLGGGIAYVKNTGGTAKANANVTTAKTVINGGEINGDVYAGGMAHGTGTEANVTTADLTLNGGTISGDVYANKGYVVDGTNGSAAVDNATLNVTGDVTVGTTDDAGSSTGGTIYASTDEGDTTPVVVNIDGGNLKAKKLEVARSTLNFNSGNLSLDETSDITDTTINVGAEANDALNGSPEALAKLLKVDESALTNLTMAEGLIADAVTLSNGKRVSKANTVLRDMLEMSTTAQLAVNRVLMNDVRKRMGDLRDSAEDAGVWMRWDGGKLKGDSGLSNDFNTIQVGADMLTGIKNVRAGVAAAFTHGDIGHSNGNGEMEAYSFSAYGTWMAENGMFADVVARVGFANTDLTVKGYKAELDNEVLSLSGEYGWRLPICSQFYVEPQVELTYTYVTSDDSKVDYASLKIDSVDSLLGRAGAVFGWNLPDNRGSLYARASVVHEFLADSKITGYAYNNTKVRSLDGEDTWLEYGLGANIKLTDSTYLWADVERTEGAEIDEEWRGTVGVRFSF